MPLFEVSNLRVSYGKALAIESVSIVVNKAELVGVLGPNGAGKTTLLNCINGVHRPQRGTISFAGRTISRMPAHRIARLGIGRTFQVVKPFPSMTVRENTAIGALYGTSGPGTTVHEAFTRADEALSRVGLSHRAGALVTSLTIPERKRLEMSRALAMRPQLLLLDESMAGLNAVEIVAALDIVRAIRDSGITVVLIEHVMQVIVGVCDRTVVLHQGRVLVEGPPDRVLKDTRVIEAYLGSRYAQQAAGNGQGIDTRG
jgi:branched-chain amino acid transport system ATP-binding protein